MKCHTTLFLAKTFAQFFEVEEKAIRDSTEIEVWRESEKQARAERLEMCERAKKTELQHDYFVMPGEIVWHLSDERKGRKFGKDAGPYRVTGIPARNQLQVEHILTGKKTVLDTANCALSRSIAEEHP